jgi:hypothetical protein
LEKFRRLTLDRRKHTSHPQRHTKSVDNDHRGKIQETLAISCYQSSKLINGSADAVVEKNMSTLAFFPWAHLPDPLSLGDVQVVPFCRGKTPGGRGTPTQQSIDRILETYCNLSGPIEKATILHLRDKDILADLNDEECAALFLFVELLAMSALSAREFFGTGMQYQNRDNFRLVIQRVMDNQDGVTIVSRRRDGSSTNFVSGDIYRVQRPQHTRSCHRNAIDLQLLEALLKARDLPEWHELYEAILGFNIANTDSRDMSANVEAVLIVGAFERLLASHRVGAKELAQLFSELVCPGQSTDIKDSAFLNLHKHRFNGTTSVRDMWIQDFYRLRNDLAHGRVQPAYKPVWGVLNHLLLASFIFPFALKCRLGKLGVYNLTSADKRGIKMFEKLALYDHHAPGTGPHDARAHPWDQVVNEALEEELRESIDQAFTDAGFIDEGGEQNPGNDARGRGEAPTGTLQE